MKQLFFNRQKKCVMDEVPMPTIGNGQLLIRVAYSVISPGTETASLQGSKQFSSTSAAKVMDKIKVKGIAQTIEIVKDKMTRLSPKGYSGSGIVVAKGEDIHEFEIGDRVAYAGSPHAEFVVAPKNLVSKLPDGVDLKQAAFTTLASIALHAVRLGEVGLGENVVVVGLGLIGQLAVGLLSASGAKVIGIDLIKERIDLAKKLGLDHGILAAETDNVVREVMQKTNGQGADVILLCAATQSSAPANQAFAYARRRARVIMVGAMGLSFNRADLYAKEIDFKVSCSYGPGRYDKNYEVNGQDYPIDYVRWTENRNLQAVLQLIADKKIDLRPLISKEVPFGPEIKQAYGSLMEDKKSSIGILIRYDQKDNAYPSDLASKVILKDKKESSGKINVGLIGVGSFSKGVLIPALKRQKRVKLAAIADINGVEAKHIAKLNGCDYAAADYRELLKDKGIDAVMIATRHNTHAQIAIEALLAGKHVHVEKPMAMDLKEALQIKEAVKTSGKLLNIGYNRRHAPFIRKLKGLLSRRSTPLMALYRVNVGSLPPNHWINDPVEGGGRLIGEICHFIDLLYWLSGSELVDLQYQKISSLNSSPSDRDNCSISFRYKDGSLATLFYSTRGHKGMGKEYLEVHCEGKIARIKDYKELELIGFGKEKTMINNRSEEKGHPEQFANFINAISGKEELATTVDDGIRVAKVLDHIIKRQ